MLPIIINITRRIGGCFPPLFGENGRKSETWFLKSSFVATLMINIKIRVKIMMKMPSIVYLWTNKKPTPQNIIMQVAIISLVQQIIYYRCNRARSGVTIILI